MKAETPNKRPPAVSQEKIVFGKLVMPWSDGELETLAQIAPGVVTAKMIAELFPNRSERTVKGMLSKVRAAGGHRRTFEINPETRGRLRLTFLHPEDPGADDGEFRRRCKLAEVADRAFVERLRACG